MTPIVSLALAFAAIIVVGTGAAWAHDALEARLGAHARRRRSAPRAGRDAPIGTPLAPRPRAATRLPRRPHGPAPTRARRTDVVHAPRPRAARPTRVQVRHLG